MRTHTAKKAPRFSGGGLFRLCKNFFLKPLDKSKKICYNVYVVGFIVQVISSLIRSATVAINSVLPGLPTG